MNNKKPEANYYSILPATVRYDKDLSANAKLMYSEITALTNTRGYCWATNDYFAKLYEVSKRSVSFWISQLAEKGYIRSVLIKDKDTNQVLERRLYINDAPYLEKTSTPQEENFHTPQEENFHTPQEENFHTPQEENFQGNSTSVNTTSTNTINNNIYITPNEPINEENEDSPTKTVKKSEIMIPTLAEITEFVTNKNFNIDCSDFLAYYSSHNWIDSKGQTVKSWKQKIYLWHANNFKKVYTGGGVAKNSIKTEDRTLRSRGLEL